MDNPLVLLPFVGAGACLILQVIAIIRLLALRKQNNDKPGLETLPDVKKWMRYTRWALLIAFVLSFVVAYLSHGAIVFVVILGLTLALAIIASTVSDNSSGHGDGDSGG